MINGEDIDNIVDYVYNHPIACYTPDILGILSKEQQDRRNFIDRFIFYYDKEHIYDIKHYNRLLSQKQAEFDKEASDFIYLDVLKPSFISLSILKKSLSNVTAEDNGCFLKLFKPNNMYNDSSIVVLPEPFSPVNNVSLLSS